MPIMMMMACTHLNELGSNGLALGLRVTQPRQACQHGLAVVHTRDGQVQVVLEHVHHALLLLCACVCVGAFASKRGGGSEERSACGFVCWAGEGVKRHEAFTDIPALTLTRSAQAAAHIQPHTPTHPHTHAAYLVPQQPVVHKHAVQPVSHHLVHQCGGHRGVNAARQSADHVLRRAHLRQRVRLCCMMCVTTGQLACSVNETNKKQSNTCSHWAHRYHEHVLCGRNGTHGLQLL
jgi:hypothetical protein